MRSSLHVMPAFIAGIHVLLSCGKEDVDAGNTSAHDVARVVALSEPHGEEHRVSDASRTMRRARNCGRRVLRDAGFARSSG